MGNKDKGKVSPKRAKRVKLPTGRPPRLLVDADMTDTIVRFLRLGSFMDQAALAAGASRQLVYAYLKRGRKENVRRRSVDDDRESEAEGAPSYFRSRANRKVRDDDDALLRKQEQPFVDFVEAIDRATGEAEGAMLGVITRAAAGGVVVSRSVRENLDGSTTVTERKSQPQWQAAAWRLERRNPERWGRRIGIEDADSAGTDSAVDVVGDLASLLDAMAQRRSAAQARQADGTFKPPSDKGDAG